MASSVPPVHRTALVHPSAVVEGRVGAHTVVEAGAYIGPLVTIGRFCHIGPGARLGQDGFGYTLGPEGWERKLQTCGVRIGDDVHIGANTCIDRGSYRHTEVRDGTRIDNLVHIAHNVIVHEECLVIAHAMLAGSVVVGPGAYIAPSACVREHLTIGAGAFVALGAVVTKDVPDGTYVKGVPAAAFHPDPASVPALPASRHVAA